MPVICPHAEQCGGCSFQHYAYVNQVAAKATVLTQLWQDEPIATHMLPIHVVPSPEPLTYRTRMDYVATKGRFGLRMPRKWNYIVDLETCHLIPPAAFAIVRSVWQYAQQCGLPDYNLRTHDGFLRYLVIRRSPQNTYLIAAITASASTDYVEPMEQLAAHALADATVSGFHWLLNDTITDVSTGSTVQVWGEPLLAMQVGNNTLAITPDSFFQNNVYLLPTLLDAIQHAVCATPQQPQNDENHALIESVADLYGGVGLIALHLAPYARHMVSVESQSDSSRLATHNAALNQTPHVQCVATDVADFLQNQPAGAFACVVADPPRIGLGKVVCDALVRIAPARIVYVSCNPLSQRDDIHMLVAGGYRLTSLTGYDMFPQTPHVEALAILDYNCEHI